MDNVLKKKPVNMEDMQAYTRILSNLGITNEGVCSTAASTAAKTVTLGATFKLENKATILIKFTNGISVANSTLAITHTSLAGVETTETAKPIYLNGAALEADIVPAGATVILRYNGTLFDIIGSAGGKIYTAGDGIDITNDEVSVDSTIPRIANSGLTVILPEFVPGIFKGTCDTAADVAAKTLDITGYELVKKSAVAVTFTNGIAVANATLNISSKGAKPIYYKGAALEAGVIKAGDIVTFIYDDNYTIINIEKGYDEPYYDSTTGFIVYPSNYPVHYDSTSGMIVFD